MIKEYIYISINKKAYYDKKHMIMLSQSQTHVVFDHNN